MGNPHVEESFCPKAGFFPGLGGGLLEMWRMRRMMETTKLCLGVVNRMFNVSVGRNGWFSFFHPEFSMTSSTGTVDGRNP